MKETGRQSRNSIADVWGERTPYEGEWPVRADEHLTEEPDRWVQSTCVLCSNCCGLDIGVKDGRMVGVRGREADRVNRGRLGPKGLNGWMANGSPDRLKRPLLRRNGKLQEASWDEAMQLIVVRSKKLIRDYTSGTMAFYNTGQLFLEEYYTLSLIALGGLGTNHLDGNTRLCTATAEVALRESFGTDGQPGSYTDIDTTDALFHIGHNVASQQTVLWMRILDRRRGPNPPRMIVVDPRRTETAREADLHIAPRLATNLALMNGLLHLIIRNGHVDQAFVEAHTLGFGTLEKTVAKYPPERVSSICDVPVRQLEEAAEILGTAPRLVSTVLQGVYQSLHATASAVQVNNLHLLRGMIGKPGCSVFQMSGQPTAVNTRECGASGSYPAMLNWENTAHMAHVARMWNLELKQIPAYSEPTYAMQIFRHAEEGSIRFLWIICTNPAVSLPDLARIRKILRKPGLFVVAQDAFLTETAELADVVLPTAMWGEKTGTYTNSNRIVHISHKAIEPPGDAKTDLDILIDYARRMDLRDKDGGPLVKWSTPEEAFNAWREMSRGRPCDYSGLSYAKLTENSGIPWPCNEKFPEGRERLYTDGVFNTEPDYCQTYGHGLSTGAEWGEKIYRAQNPQGRAFLKAADYEPPQEVPNGEYPFWVTTGRVVYHWHTRTKTGRAQPLQEAAPEAFVEVAEEDATNLSIRDGDWVEVRTRRGHVRAPARVGNIRPGHLFVPFHYGYWDRPESDQAANEFTLTGWDPVSRQPYFKFAAAQLQRLEDQGIGGKLMERAHDMATKIEEQVFDAMSVSKEALTPTRPGQHVKVYLGMARRGEQALAEAYETVGKRHAEQAEVGWRCQEFAAWCRRHAESLAPSVERYGEDREAEGESLRRAMFGSVRQGSLGLLRDLHDLHTLVGHIGISYFALKQAGSALQDTTLTELAVSRMQEISSEEHWLNRQIRSLAAQALVVPSLP